MIPDNAWQYIADRVNTAPGRRILYNPADNVVRYFDTPWARIRPNNATQTYPDLSLPENDQINSGPPFPSSDRLNSHQQDSHPAWDSSDQMREHLAGLGEQDQLDHTNWTPNGVSLTRDFSQARPASLRASPMTIHSEISAEGNATYTPLAPGSVDHISRVNSTIGPNNFTESDHVVLDQVPADLIEPKLSVAGLVQSQEQPQILSQEIAVAGVGIHGNAVPVTPAGSNTRPSTPYSAVSSFNSPARLQSRRAAKMYKSAVANPRKEQIQQRLDQELLASSLDEPPVFPADSTAFHHSITSPASSMLDHDDQENPGRSAFKQQDLFFHAEDIIAEPGNAAKVTTVFSTQDEADAYMNSRLTPESSFDPTVPTTNDQRRALVGVLVQAFKSTTDKVRDNKGALKAFENEVHDNRLVEWCMWHLLNNIVQASQARESIQVVLGGPSQFRGHVYQNFAERFNAVRWVLTYRKGSCKNLIETCESVKLADDPLANFEKAMDNKSLNGHKKRLIAQGVAVESQRTGKAGEASTPHPEDKRRQQKRKAEDDNDESRETDGAAVVEENNSDDDISTTVKGKEVKRTAPRRSVKRARALSGQSQSS